MDATDSTVIRAIMDITDKIGTTDMNVTKAIMDITVIKSIMDSLGIYIEASCSHRHHCSYGLVKYLPTAGRMWIGAFSKYGFLLKKKKNK
jgi:hypothetical protein